MKINEDENFNSQRIIATDIAKRIESEAESKGPLKSIQQRRVGGGAPARINYEELLSKQANP